MLWPFSLVLCPYGVQGEVSGILGVLGPTRLAYADAIGNVRFLSDVMTDMVCSVHDIER
jgi:heat-inducible transcriptional repressor